MEVQVLSHDTCAMVLQEIEAYSGPVKGLITIIVPPFANESAASVGAQMYKYATEVRDVGDVPVPSRKSRQWAAKVIAQFSKELPAVPDGAGLVVFVGQCSKGGGEVSRCYVVRSELEPDQTIPKGELVIDNRFAVSGLKKVVDHSRQSRAQATSNEVRGLFIRFQKERARPAPNLTETGLEEVLYAAKGGAVDFVLLDPRSASRQVCAACLFPLADDENAEAGCPNCGASSFKESRELLSTMVSSVHVLPTSTDFGDWGPEYHGCVAVLRFRYRW